MSRMNRKTTELDSATDKDSNQLETAMLGAAIATEKLAPAIEKNRDDIRTLSNRLGSLASKLGHTLDKPRATITIKRFLIFFVILGSCLTGTGMYTVNSIKETMQNRNDDLTKEVSSLIESHNQTSEHERKLSLVYHQNRQAVEQELRDQIDRLVIEVENMDVLNKLFRAAAADDPGILVKHNIDVTEVPVFYMEWALKNKQRFPQLVDHFGLNEEAISKK